MIAERANVQRRLSRRLPDVIARARANLEDWTGA